jgi:hypothetical protein
MTNGRDQGGRCLLRVAVRDHPHSGFVLRHFFVIGYFVIRHFEETVPQIESNRSFK